MLTFFRRIRKGLLEGGATSKYLLYAVGEIALVVIGILIALQVNNWNEWRKTKKIEDKLLTELLSTVKTDCTFLDFEIEQNKRFQMSCEIILSHLENDSPYHDSLDFHFMNSNNWMAILLRTNTYENAKSHGLDFVSDSLNTMLTTLYDGALTFGQIMNERQNLYYYNTAVPILTRLFKETTSPLLGQAGVVPNNYEDLKYQNEYHNILRTSIRNRRNENRWFNNILSQMYILEKHLLKEIEIR